MADVSVQTALARVQMTNVSVQMANVSVQMTNVSLQMANVSLHMANVSLHSAVAGAHSACADVQLAKFPRLSSGKRASIGAVPTTCVSPVAQSGLSLKPDFIKN